MHKCALWGMGGVPHGDVGRGTPRSHGVTTGMGVLHPAFVLAESLTRGTSWRLAGRLLRVLENMHSPKVGLGEASLRDSDKHACGACRCDSPRARMAARFADSSTGAGYGPVPTGHREVRYPYLERGPRKGEAPAVVGKLQGPLASHQPQLDRTHEPIL